MYKTFIVLYNFCGSELDSIEVEVGGNISATLASHLASGDWCLNEGDTINIEERWTEVE